MASKWQSALAKLVFCLGMTAFCIFQFWEWYAAGQLYAGRWWNWIGYAEHPLFFVVLATVYILTFLLFGYGLIQSLTEDPERR